MSKHGSHATTQQLEQQIVSFVSIVGFGEGFLA